MLLPPLIPTPGSRATFPPLHGSADALALAELARSARPLAIITETAQDAERLREEIAFFDPTLRVFLLPDWETLPYDSFSPHQDLISERLATLYQITHDAFDVAVVPITTALYRLPPAAYLAAYTFFLKQGDKLDANSMRRQLTLAGYSHVTQVVSPGEFSFRGGVIDLFPMGSPLPYRIDLFDDEIESIRSFDVDTQRSIYKVKEVRLLPAREFPTDDNARTTFRQRFREKFEGDPSKSRLYKDMSQGFVPAGIEYYLPLFFESTATLADYLPAGTLVSLHQNVAKAISQFWRDTQSRYNLLRGDPDRPLLPPAELFLREDEFFGSLKPFPRIETASAANSESAAAPAPTQALPPVAVDRRADNPLAALSAFHGNYGGRVLLIAESMGRRETLLGLLNEYQVRPKVCDGWQAFKDASERMMLTVGPIHAGFVDSGDAVALITENELYPSQIRTRVSRERRIATEGMLRDLSEVKIGDPVVHAQHGIGRYLGLANMNLGDGETEFLTLEYDGGDKLYVPVSQLAVIGRYSGAAPEAAPLHKLGSGQWEKARRRAAAQVRDTAAELLNLYALRAARLGYAFELKPHDYEAFREGFPFEETPDQAAAIQAVIGDMGAGKPMDRLVCGDVGFGKTEVALRAAFVAVADSKQVAVLVPTTLLAEQHFQTFSDRFADWPVKIAELSRFRSAKETSGALEGLEQGRVDIAIGTHKLLSRGVKFKDLGLVIIDEEHRFGVRQKEKLKALRAQVDVLTLTATPIPRTLAMALEGLRDFSVIATAPQRRLAIKTFVSPLSEGLIREAVLRELKRGGQVYFLHNEIETIRNMEARVAKLLPEARIRTAHGQMPERELELVMRDFYQGRFNLLLCTTIIETGIDVPTANTIIINRADKFGLAQLHQLRGRVGRSHHQAYAYLLTPDEDAIGSQARKRLEAIQMMEELGSGFYLAMHDLEIRGAGEVLGESQSGEMQEVGFALYAEMLNAAVKSLKAGKEPELSGNFNPGTEINLHAPALLPEDYCADIHERLVLYKRLANCETPEELEAMHEELVDRFGLLPDPAKVLLETHRLRITARQLGISRIDAGPESLLLQFIPNPPLDPAKIIGLVQSRKNFKLSGQDRLRVEAAMPDIAARVSQARAVLKDLG
ncbi:MAG TPA: transcription-repair coupling factor [Burkholderiales bacterium]|nr:transcription-repair coupling factor [Burkholderiales bacterium]